MNKLLTVSLLLLTMSVPALVLAQSPSASRTNLTQARAALAQALAARAVRAAGASKSAVMKLTAPLAQAHPATAVSTLQPAAWSDADLKVATYVVLAASMDGEPDTFSADQQRLLLTAMQHDLQGALKRRYPVAIFSTDPNTPGAIVMRPVLTVPVALVASNSFQARIEIRQNGGSAVLKDTFGMLELYLHQENVANYVFDRLVAMLP
jgi:hypothetical protein